MKRGFTLIEVILAMVITLLMILVASDMIIDIIQTFNSEAEVITVRDTIAVMEGRMEGVFRDSIDDIIIYEDETSVPASGTCYFYNLADNRMKVFTDGTGPSDAAGFPLGTGNQNEVSAIRFVDYETIDSTVTNAVHVEFYIQDKGDASTSRLYQEFTLSTLNPHINITTVGTSDNNVNMICFE